MQTFNIKYKSFFDVKIENITFLKKTKRRLTNSEFIKKAKNIHGDNFEYSKCEYKNMSTKVNIICKKHNIMFAQTPTNHLHNSIGCPVCNKNVNSIITHEEFIKKANKKYNNKFDYSLIKYKNRNDIIKIICPKHGIFKQAINKHLRGDDCPDCNKEINENIVSLGETIIKNWLIRNKIKFLTQKTFNNCKNIKKLRFDFYLPTQNILIEYDGKQHFEPIEFLGGKYEYKLRKSNDKIKTEYAKNNNIKLLRIPYTERKNISNILKNNIIN